MRQVKTIGLSKSLKTRKYDPSRGLSEPQFFPNPSLERESGKNNTNIILAATLLATARTKVVLERSCLLFIKNLIFVIHEWVGQREQNFYCHS